ncbi:MAG: acyltransferase [Candidatus Ochrobactrum gambitense]|nr:MAG: acyltransferase [Candidatus Ochrobactrum gambitense]WEK16969.1 MAG: acyltransferase [Candidatus Ochrobactrum gambitense]
MSRSSGRIALLEGLRGIAALVVVIWHSTLAFAPEYAGIFNGFDHSSSWMGKPWFVLINGTGAVALFFVLSGFVLTISAIRQVDNRVIYRGLLKRWPRLALPVVISTVASWLLFTLGLYHFTEASGVSNSPWLGAFGFAEEIPSERTLSDAVAQGVFLTFWRGDAYFNSSLWTMHFEMIGSLIAFGGAIIFNTFRRSLLVCGLIIACMFWGTYLSSPWYVCFVIGFLISVSANRIPSLQPTLIAALVLAGIFLLGFSQPKGYYSWLWWPNFVIVNGVGSALLIVALLQIKAPRSLNHLCLMLGELSFPVYLVHLLVIMSFGSSIYLRYGAVTAFISVMFFSIVMSIPLIWINRNWLRIINSVGQPNIIKRPDEPQPN